MIFSSVSLACPEVWVSVKGLLTMTLAPALKSLLIVRLMYSWLPGMGEEEKTMVSPGIILICLCEPSAILDKAAKGSPWEPVLKIVIFFRR